MTTPRYRTILRAHRVAQTVEAVAPGGRLVRLRRQQVTTCIVIVALLALTGLCVPGWALPLEAAAPPSCATPAANFATLTACKTETAAALLGTPTPTRPTVTASATRALAPQFTPTRLPATPGAAAPVSVVLFGVTYPLDVDRDCVRAGGRLSCKVEIWVVLGPTPTATALVER